MTLAGSRDGPDGPPRPAVSRNCSTSPGTASRASAVPVASGTSRTVTDWLTAGHRGQDGGQADAALEPGRAEGPADDGGGLEDDSAARQAAGPGDEVSGQQHVAEPTGPVVAEPGREEYGGQCERDPARRDIGDQDSHDEGCRQDERPRERTGVAPAYGGRSVADQLGDDRLRRAEHLGGHAPGDLLRRGRDQGRGALLLAVEAGDDRGQPCAAGQPQSRAVRRG